MKCLEHIERLRAAIESGELAPGDLIGTEFAFSQEWGLARNTVRRGIEKLVAAGLLERRPGKGLYVRSPHRTTRSVQVVAPSLSWAHQVKVARGVHRAARLRGVQALVADAHGEIEQGLEALRRLPGSAFDGAVIVSMHDYRFNEALFELKSVNYPFVLVDQRLHDLETDTVEVDNYSGAYLIGKKLAAAGHRRAVFLGPTKLQIVNERLNGFRDAMLDSRIMFDRSLIVNLGGEGLTEWMDERMLSTEEAVTRVLQSPDRPSAIFDGTGDVAPYIHRTATRMGFRIPDDLSIVSFDESPIHFFLDPEISRLRHPWIKVGEIALEMLLEQMQASKSRASSKVACEHRVVSAEWIAGGSIAAPKK